MVGRGTVAARATVPRPPALDAPGPEGGGTGTARTPERAGQPATERKTG
ncbi:hypothetical protein DER29_6511 [Micromonospora sp. M71_S20]|nr:hypothetical protein DER29_6511 [Micromonospora sp. M71_S20]